MKYGKTKQLTICGILISMALVLSYIERFLPLHLIIPLPGIKLGLANIVTLIALYVLGVKSTFTILILRCILGAIFGGGVSGLAFSLSGGILAMTVMTIAKRSKGISVYGVSMMGAAAHNIGQTLIAVVLMGSIYVIGYLPYLLIVSIFTGLATGAMVAGVLRVLGNTRLAEE